MRVKSSFLDGLTSLLLNKSTITYIATIKLFLGTYPTTINGFHLCTQVPAAIARQYGVLVGKGETVEPLP